MRASKRAVGVREQPERGAAFAVDQVEQLGAFFVILPGAIGFEAQEFAHAERGFAAAEVFRGDAVAARGLLRADRRGRGRSRRARRE